MLHPPGTSAFALGHVLTNLGTDAGTDALEAGYDPGKDALETGLDEYGDEAAE